MTCSLVIPVALAGETVERSTHLHLETDPRAVQDARRFVAEQAPALREDTLAVLVLLTSELVTNAVVHARTPFTVGLTVSTQHVLLTVYDLDLDLPADGGSQDREGGRGLDLVAALADSSDLTRHREGGKTAWFRVARDA